MLTTMDKPSLHKIVFLCILLLLTACQGAPKEPDQVVRAFIAAVDAENASRASNFLADEVIFAYQTEEKTASKDEIISQAQGLFEDYDFSLKTSDFQVNGGEVYFSLTVSEREKEWTGQCTCQAIIEEGKINFLKVVYCSED